MNEEASFDRQLIDMEEAFRAYRKSLHDAYEAERARAEALDRAQAEDRGRVLDEQRRMLERAGIGQVEIEAMQQAEAERRERFLETVRPASVERNADFNKRLRDQLCFKLFYSRSGWQQAVLLGADLFTGDERRLEKVEGVRGNPSVWLYDANKLDVSDMESGDGSGCAPPGLRFQERVHWYYSWVPPGNGAYSILAGQYYHGFYILKANRGPFNCRSAMVRADAEITVHQYFQRTAQKRSMFTKKGENISENGFLDGSTVWSFGEYLGGGDQVLITVMVDVEADARGSGSYAEINFASGLANYVNAPMVFIYKN